MVTHSNELETTLDITGLQVRYGRRNVLGNYTLQPLRGGRLTALLGPNASGKSTLIKSVAGVVKKHNGTVTGHLAGRELTGKALRTRTGYMPQDLPHSAALSAFEAIVVATKQGHAASARETAANVMEQLGITGLAQRYLAELSGGQRQLVACAQMLATNPDFLLLDEPTSALDLRRQMFLLKVVRQHVQQRGAVALIAIHDINLAARMCDDMVLMRNGKPLAQGTPNDVLTPELIREIYGIDAEVLTHNGVPVVSPVG